MRLRLLSLAAACRILITPRARSVADCPVPRGGRAAPDPRSPIPAAICSVWRCPTWSATGPWPRRRRSSSGAALDIFGLFNLINPVSFPPDLQREGMGFSSALWSQVGAQGVVKLRVAREGGGVAIEGRLYQVGRGEGSLLSRDLPGRQPAPAGPRLDQRRHRAFHRAARGFRVAHRLRAGGRQERRSAAWAPTAATSR